jgi:hypothetical protein
LSIDLYAFYYNYVKKSSPSDFILLESKNGGEIGDM